MKSALLLFLIGFFLGPLGDLFHVLSDTVGYHEGVWGFYIWRWPYWVPFLFAGATLVIGLSHPLLDRILGPSEPRPGVKNIQVVILGLAAFLALYAVSGFLPWDNFGLNDAVLAIGALMIWSWFDRTWQGILLGVLTGIAGAVMEIFLIRRGAFFYLPEAANLFGVASWLPWLYFAASVTVGNLGRFLQRKNSRSHAG